MTEARPVLIIGAGLAGLRCALSLQEQGIPYLLLDKASGPGGRIRTDSVDGFRLDRGFQVLLTGYPEVRSVMDMASLDLHPFRAGALIRRNGTFHRLSDPFRHPADTLRTLAAGMGTFKDKLRILSLRRAARSSGVSEQGHRPAGRSIREALEDRGFSRDMIEGFFRPFLGGITLNAELQSDEAFFTFVMRMFSDGHAALPAGGMQALPDQLAGRLDASRLMWNAEVVRVEGNHSVILSDGRRLEGAHVVLATDMYAASEFGAAGGQRTWNGTTCLYFAADEAPISEPVLVLNGEPDDPTDAGWRINSVVVPSLVAPGYAPEGIHLINISCVGVAPGSDTDLEALALTQMRSWFGPSVDTWQHLRTYHIPRALPSQHAGSLNRESIPLQVSPDGPVVCGDHVTTSSINGALASGRAAATYLIEHLALRAPAS
ncbi:MAG: NAD(P)/FAD-dependent oxidoreductase [Bacteroidetes bacterium]|nr:NAD(P)/FAD-dependent oxidoreductase [Bacteroidota bacterium]